MPFFRTHPWFKFTQGLYYFNGQTERRGNKLDGTEGIRLSMGAQDKFYEIKLPIESVDKLLDWIVRAYPERYGRIEPRVLGNEERGNVIHLATILPLPSPTRDPGPGPDDPIE